MARCRFSLRRTSKSRFSDSGTRSRRIGPRSRIVFGDRASTTPKKTSPTSVDPSLKVWNDVLTSKRKIITCSQCKNYLLTWGNRHSDSSRETVGSILCATNSFFIMIQSKLCCLGIAGCGIVLKGLAQFSWSVPLHCGTLLRPHHYHWEMGKERGGKSQHPAGIEPTTPRGVSSTALLQPLTQTCVNFLRMDDGPVWKDDFWSGVIVHLKEDAVAVELLVQIDFRNRTLSSS